MATLQPIGWLAAVNNPAPIRFYNTSYVLSANERSTGTEVSSWKAAVFQVSASSSTELTVSAQITAPSGDELGGLQCYVFSVPTNISASYPVTIYDYMQLAEQHTTATSSTFTFNISHSGYLGVCITDYRVGSTRQALKINSVSYGSDSDPGTGDTTPTQQKITITARPGQPSGNSVAFAEGAQFTWSISSIPEDRIYQGTQIQFTDASDVTGSHPIFDRTIDGLVAQYNYTTPLSPNSDYIWRAKAVLKNYSQVSTNQNSGSTSSGDVILYDSYVYEENIGGSSSTATETVIETPWSDWQTFHTKDYEQVSVTVTTSSPENNASFVYGKQISFRWSVSGGSGVTISSSTIMLDGNALDTIDGNGTSYTLTEDNAKQYATVGTHTWYVKVNCGPSSAGQTIVGSLESNRNTLYIGDAVATANPGSPSGSSSVKPQSPVQFSWSISKNGDGDYTGSELQWRYSNSSSWKSLGTVERGVTTFTYESGFTANSVVQWRVRTSLNGKYAPDGGWSEPASFAVGDYDQVSVTVTTSSPENNASFVHGKQISFRWSISGGSGVTINSSTIMVDGTALTTINGTGTSYTLSDNDAKMLGVGTHTWYVTVDCSPNSSSVVLVGSPSSDRNTFYIGAPVATANPSSPSGSTTVNGNAAVQFSWSISKNGDGDYTGSELEWRYSNESSWHYLGKTQHSVTTFTYESGFAANRVVQWRVRTSLNGIYGANDGWSEPASFTVGDIEIFDARPNLIQPKGTVKGDGEIVFAWTVDCQTGVSGCIAEYSTDGGITWLSLGNYTIENGTYIIRKAAGTFLLPAGSVEWCVSAAGNGDYGSPVQSSFTVSYEAYGRITTSSAYINSGVRRSQRIEFDATLQIVGTTSETITFSDASFCWKMANGSEYAEEAMTVSDDSATISFIANKFPAGVLLWYLKAHDSKNNDSETAVYATYILKSGIDTFAIKPIPNVYETINQLDFEWGFIAQNKELSNGTEIRFSFDGYTWEDPIPIDSRIRSNSSTGTYVETNLVESLFTGTGTFTLEENYFSAGRIKFQIRSKSSDGIIGEWSEESQFVMRGLPKVGDFACDAKPFTTFTWTANEQISYEILLDDEVTYGPFHGTEKTFTLPEPLQDGSHTAALRVQNSLSLFGEASEISFNVSNESSAAVPLKMRIEAGVDANLFWAPIVISDDNEFLVYCDDRLIARLPSDVTSYCDRLTLGAHTYTVYQRLTSGDYDIYMHSPVEMHSDTTRLALYEGGPWIGLVLTTDPYPVNTYTHSRAVEKTKIFGTKYPVVEIGDFEEATGSYEVCWPFANYSQMKLFDALIGSAIIIKGRADQIICGVLESCSFDVNSQFIKCTFQLDQMSTDVDLSIAIRPDVNFGFMTNLDKVYFGQMTTAELGMTTSNPGYTDPRFYEEIAEAINERLRAARLLD